MELVLTAKQPFLFTSTVRSHGWYQLAPLDWDDEQQILRTVEQLSTGTVLLIEVRQHKSGIKVTSEGRLAKREKDELAQRLTWMFALETDLSEFYDHADGEPRLAHCRKTAQGRFLRSTTLFEDVVRVMMTTNIQWSGTKRLVAKLVDHFGNPISDLQSSPSQFPDLTPVKAFPSAAALAASDEATLRGLGLGYRSPYLLKLAQGVVNGAIDLKAFKTEATPTDALRKDLIKLPGIGPYAAATLLSLLGRYDYLTVDSEAVSVVSKRFYAGQPVGEKEVYAVFGKWGKFKQLAYWFWDYEGMGQTPMDDWEARKKDTP